jgi:hypothetical protein
VQLKDRCHAPLSRGGVTMQLTQTTVTHLESIGPVSRNRRCNQSCVLSD